MAAPDIGTALHGAAKSALLGQKQASLYHLTSSQGCPGHRHLKWTELREYLIGGILNLGLVTSSPLSDSTVL